MPFALKVWDFMVGAFKVIKTVGAFIFDIVEYITRPDGILAKIIKFVVGTVFAIKKGIKWLIGKSGKDNIKALCMYLAGDTIGLLLHAALGAIKKFWRWLKTTKLMKVILNIIDAITGFFKMFGEMWDNFKKIPWS